MTGNMKERYKDDKWTEYTQFKDTVHGYIKIHKPLAKKIINAREFQRLKNVEQTGMGVLYPSATHNRFIHSLGVYHLGTIAFQNFKENIRAKYNKECYYMGRPASDASRHWCVWEILFKLACLLHDIGHTPFSHSLEILYDADYIENVSPDSRHAENSRMNILLYREIKNPKSKCDFKIHIKSGKAQHERMSAHLILTDVGNLDDKSGTNFKGKIKDLVCSYVHAKCPDAEIIDEYIPGYDFEDDLEFMARMIVGCLYKWESEPSKYLETRTAIGKDRQDPGAWTRELQLRNCIIKILNSSIDVDNLDYATRDMQCSGYANALVDIERLLNSFTVIEGVKCENVDIDFTEKKRIHNPVEYTYFKGDKFRINLFGKHNVRIDQSVDGKNIKITDEDRTDEDKTDKPPKKKEEKKPAKKKEEKKPEYLITKKSEHENGTDRWMVELSWDPMITTMGKDRPEGVAHMYLNGRMKGVFTGKIYGETYLSSNENRDTAEITRFFEFAFDKTSQSVVDGAVSARNYEYLWIYAHHTITYHTNYLTMHMLKQYCEILHEKNKENILDKLLYILESPPKGPAVFSAEDTKNREIDIDNLFYDLFDAILSFSPIRRLITKKNKKQMEEFAHLAAKCKFWYKNANSRNEIQGNLKPMVQQIKEFLGGILEADGENEGILFNLMELYNNLNDRNLKTLRGERKGEYLKEAFDWIANLLNVYYIIPPNPRVRKKLINIFKELVQLVEDVIKNESTDVFQRAEIFLSNMELKDQKLRLSNDTLKYMCDVIAMLDKKTINNFVYSRSGDDDLNAYYRSLENVLSQKDEVNRTPNEREFLAVADEYFSRNFAAAMWKTYTEYTYLFRNWEEEEINRLPKTFDNFLILTGGGVINDKDYFDYIYFVLSENMTRLTDEQREIYILLQKYGITRFVFVRQNVKAKTLDAYSTFFAFKENVLRFRDIELFNKQKINRPFFYFYYKRNDGSPLETDEVTKLLEELHDMIKEKIEKAAESGSGPNKQKG